MAIAIYPPEAIQRRGPRGLSDGRSPFARDRDRLLYSESLHGLSGKSQVIASAHVGQFHNRLTHSLKVGQLGRRAAERIRERWGGPGIGADIAAPDPDLVEFACLAHDIGHPPFGHNGERALQAAVDRAAVNYGVDPIGFGGFEGNPQSLRVVSRLTQKRLDDDDTDGGEWIPENWFGIDPTSGSVDSVSKYPWARQAGYDKWGFYGEPDMPYSDGSTFRWARALTGGDGGDAVCFEAQLMDWCDDIAYAVHDVEDFYRAGMIPMHLLFGDPAVSERGLDRTEWEGFKEFVADRWGETDKWPHLSESERLDRIEHIRDTLLSQVRGMKVGVLHDDRVADLRASSFRSSRLTRHFMAKVDVRDGGCPMLHEGSLSVHDDPELEELMKDQRDLLKELIWAYVLKSPIVGSIRDSQRHIITGLFEFFMEDPYRMPRYFVDIMEHGSGYTNEDEFTIRSVADYVSSLTESQASDMFHRISGSDTNVSVAVDDIKELRRWAPAVSDAS